MSDPVLSVRGVTRRYDAVTALADVSLELSAGQVLGLAGPNGAGKTTLMRIAATLDFPTSGDVLLSGVDVVAAPDVVRRWIGYMPEIFGLYEELLVREYLELFAALALPDGAQRRAVDDVLELTDLTALAASPVRVLSRGVRQRLFLARTLLADPRLLLLDEPSAGLDPRARAELGALLRELASLGKAIVISSHVLSELDGVADRLAVIERGKLVYSGPAHPADAHQVDVTCLERPEEVERRAATHAGVEALARDGDHVRFRFRGEPRALAALHRALATDGPLLLSFEARRPTLEELYFRVTRGEIG